MKSTSKLTTSDTHGKLNVVEVVPIDSPTRCLLPPLQLAQMAASSNRWFWTVSWTGSRLRLRIMGGRSRLRAHPTAEAASTMARQATSFLTADLPDGGDDDAR